ncbi:MAG: tRNA-dihydrouridine synthase, partial [Kiritimatiellae bacterium]|nr:tRNA-dihydrouridine synthase [Kiritimatiellia bacterium]
MAGELPYEEHGAVLAPLCGYTDLPFRQACRRYGCRYAFTPLIDAGSLVYGNPRNSVSLVRGDDEPWLGVQLLGSAPELLTRGARLLNGFAFDVLDLNMGCPVPKV